MEQVPKGIPDLVREYIFRQLNKLELAIQNANQLPKLTTLPDKPSIGKIYYFANATGAVTSEGAWEYTSTGWNKLGNVGGGGGGGGSGTVTNVSVTTANGISGTVATPTTTPAISLALGAITPSSVAATGTVNGTNLSGTNTGDETVTTIKSKLGITTLSGSNTGDQTITLTGDVTGSGAGSFAATLATVANSGTGTFNKFNIDTKGRVTGTTPVLTADLTALLSATYQPLNANLTSWSALAPSAKQDTLVSGTNIKTINGASVLGSGNLVVTGSGGTLVTSGSATVDFGAFPGSFDCSTVITGQAGILSTSTVKVWIAPKVTVDHSEDEHIFEPVYVFVPASTIVAGVGFTIRGAVEGVNRCYGQFNVMWEWF